MITVRLIVDVVGPALGVPDRDLISHSRGAMPTWARQVAMYIARGLTMESDARIGEIVGGRTAGDVAKAIRTVASRVASDPAAAAQVDALMRGVRAIAEARPAMGKPTPQDVDAEALAVRALASGDAVLALSTADIQQLAGAVLTERLTPSSADLINAALEMVEASRVDLSRAFSGARRDVALRRRDAAEGLRAAATAWRRAHWAGNVQTNKQVKHG